MNNQKQPQELKQRVLQFIRRNKLVKPDHKVLVAVSGGADSVCLLHTLYELQKELSITLHIAHLNHGLRGAEADSDARYVAELARKLNLPATIEKRDVSSFQKQHGLSLEEAAREVRYNFLAQIGQTINAQVVATGHTENDQVETILLHILRGTGIRGLRGLQPLQKLKFGQNTLTIIRPLLEIKREETEGYCVKQLLTPCTDSSNFSLSLLRNRVRRELLPVLKSYNPGIFESLLRLGRIAGDDLNYLEAETARIFPEVAVKKDNNWMLDKSAFQALPPALQRQILRRAIEDLLGTLKDIETRHIEAILDILDKPAGRQINLPEGLIFSIEYNRYLLGFYPDQLIPFPEIPGDYDIRVPGKTVIPGWQIEATVEPNLSLDDISESLDAWNNDGFTAFFDKDKVGDKIKVRARRTGDWFQPLGMDQPKKIGEFMLDAHIPQGWRPRIPIIYTPQQIIWVAGWRIDERVKVNRQTREVLGLKLVRWADGESGEGRGNR